METHVVWKRKNIINGQVETSGRFIFNEEPLGFDS
jgi:hypothetical protein